MGRIQVLVSPRGYFGPCRAGAQMRPMALVTHATCMASSRRNFLRISSFLRLGALSIRISVASRLAWIC